MNGERISIGQQLEAVRFAAERQALLNTGVRVKDERPEAVRDYELQRLLAAVETLTWLKANADSVKAAHAALRAGREAGDGMGGET